MITYNKVKILLTGDMEGSVETANLSKWSDVDVLKAGHHGSYTASLATFLNIIRPEYVIVSAGANNTYGHPHKGKRWTVSPRSARLYTVRSKVEPL